MFVVRPAETSDILALETLAAITTFGVHTLPRTRKSIEKTVDRSIASFARQPQLPADESYCFVLEAPDGSLAGSALISATAGANGTFFAFRNDVLNQVSRDLDISHNVHALTLCSDLTGHSQLSSFHLRNRRNAGAEAALLSRARLLFAAAAPQRFSDRFFASMSGVIDGDGRSPFWEALGRKFFGMDFLEAERMIEGARNRTVIVELMPHYPVYVPLLPADAQAAMEQVHPDGELPFRILSEEGFVSDKYIDIFDGAPVLRAHKNALRSFTDAVACSASAGEDPEAGARLTCLVATLRDEHFRAVMARCSLPPETESVMLPADAMRRLDVVDGDSILCVSL
ncbi:arginine N-succinyltransferase [Noviherbaspirillum sp. CPCC 100848]|uniref:Arginine N-succinyltransferase n=1 Tax=Noviherbaspirillum album TaxID=3080276 RepID=A0ABU6J7Y5_9BURK|nr:arginine N-succinyltransferase [Noviherbaspirillum sp. CPCC 100848]MEC4719623.1 arginine N-succinyltransferase [Noviherbaspirillum sp. CPCC 100848]